MVEKRRKFSQTELDPETPQSTKSLNFAKLLISLFVAKSKVTFCVSFAKHQNESTTGIHTLPILN